MSPGPGATSHHLPPHPEQQNRPRERVPVSKCHPRAVQRHPGQAECGRSHTARGHWLPAVGLGTAPLPASHSHLQEAVDGAHLHVQLVPPQQDSTRKCQSTRDTTRTSTKPPPKHPQQLGLPSAPSSGLNWHRVPGYPAILIPAPCLDQSSPLGSRIVFSRASECPARLGLPVAGIALPVQMFQLQGRVRPCHSHPRCPPLQEPSPSL